MIKGISIYVIQFVLIILLALYYNNSLKKSIMINKKKYFSITVSVFLILILGLRNITIGIDTYRYVNKFLNPYIIKNNEYGYFALMKLIGFFTDNWTIYLFIIAIISIVPISIVIYRYSEWPLLSFIMILSLNYYAFMFSGIRQAIAYALVFLSYIFIDKKKPVIFVLLVLLASTFHFSALIFLPAYLLVKIKVNNKTLTMIFLANLLFFILKKPIMSLIIKYFYSQYSVKPIEGFSGWYLFSLAMVLVCLIFREKTNIRVPKTNNLYMIVIIGISVMMLIFVSDNASRAANYYFYFIIILLPNVIKTIVNCDNKLKVLISFLVITCFAILYLGLLMKNGYNIVPYRFFWS